MAKLLHSVFSIKILYFSDPYSSATLQPNTANLKAEELTEDQIADAFADFVTKESTFKKPKDPKKDLKIVNFSQQCYLKYTLSSYVETRYVDERRETEYSPAQLMATESRLQNLSKLDISKLDSALCHSNLDC